MKWWIWVVLGLWIAGVVGLGCSPTADTNGGGDEPISKDTPDHLLNFLADSYANKDGERYEEALHDAFIFVFTSDIAETLGLPPEEPWWGKTRDVASTKKMFETTQVTEVDMSYISVDPWVAVTCSVGGQEYSGVFSRVQPEILVTVENPGEEALTYLVNESWLDITVVKDPKVTEEDLFVILKIEEILMNPQ